MASKRRLRRKSCEGKVRYTTSERAIAECYGGMHVYRCKFCRGYHIGHYTKEQRQIRKEG